MEGTSCRNEGAPLTEGPPTDAVEVARRRRRVALAGHSGDEGSVRAHLSDPAPGVRAAALGALRRIPNLTATDLAAALRDPAVGVRRRACELAATVPDADLEPCLSDSDPAVVEVAAWAMGERGEGRHVPALAELAAHHPEAACRESAVAALGAIGDSRGLPAILRALGDRPAVRRRAVIALAPFEGPAVEDGLNRACRDRDWQVRQAAEDLISPHP